MNKLVNSILFLAIWFLAIHVSRGQSTVNVSNLEQTPTGSMAVGSDAWIAQEFDSIYNANNTSQYILNSVQLLMNPASGNPAGFTVSIYSSSDGSGAPQNDLGTLSGPDPSAGGIFTYTSASGIPLLPFNNEFPQINYFVVVTAATPIAQGAYVWSAANGETLASDSWYIQDSYSSSANGSSWTVTSREDVFQMALNITAVPEPSSLVLCLLGGGFAFYLHARNRTILDSSK